MKTDLGLIHVYTGEGKGKTTAAVGLATRALGHGFKVCYTSFHKRPEKYGYNEIQSLEKLGAKVISFAKGHPHMDKSLDSEEIAREALEGISHLNKLLAQESFDLLVMDEVLISIRDNYLSEDKLVEFIQNKPNNMELVMTGRGATPRIIEMVDYATNLQKVKHPYDQGITSREGIEF